VTGYDFDEMIGNGKAKDSKAVPQSGEGKMKMKMKDSTLMQVLLGVTFMGILVAVVLMPPVNLKPKHPFKEFASTEQIESTKIFIFSVAGKEFLRFESDGKFYVQGRLTASDTEVFEAFKKIVEKQHSR